MFIQDNLLEPKVASGDWVRDSRFLFMFIGVVVVPLMLFAIGGRGPDTSWQLGLALPFLTIALLLSISVGIGRRMFGYVAKDLSISPKRV